MQLILESKPDGVKKLDFEEGDTLVTQNDSKGRPQMLILIEAENVVRIVFNPYKLKQYKHLLEVDTVEK